MFVLIAYDISDDKRRKKVDSLLSGYGERVNYSLFEIKTTKSELNKIISNLENVTIKEDKVRVYILNKEVLKKSFTIHKNGGIFDEKELYF